jgi:hypothetical protein
MTEEEREFIWGLPAPCYYHLGLRIWDKPRVESWRALQQAKGRLRRRVQTHGGDPEEIRYTAGLGPLLLEELRRFFRGDTSKKEPSHD